MLSFLKDFKLEKKTKIKNPRSVVFYRQSYYHFFYLAKALRERGWDAVLVNLEPTDGPNKNYYHGEDINLYHPSRLIMQKKLFNFYNEALNRFQMMHFAGDGCMSFFSNKFLNNQIDIIKWKKYGNKVAYTVSGCNSGITPKSLGQWSEAYNGLNVCNRCIWQNNDKVCSNNKSIAWGKRIQNYCDLIFSENLPSLDYLSSCEKVYREPLTTVLDPEVWAFPLIIPEKYLISKHPDEILIYHAVGNYDSRHNEHKNIKGTPFVKKAIEKLQQEGFKVRLIFFTNVPNINIRFYQAQADIIVDQLNLGRYGATAREGMMLGKPVISFINSYEYKKSDELLSLKDCPLVSANEETIYDVLKKLIIDKDLRTNLSKKSREYALKWHSAKNNAERYEEIYDQLFKNRDVW